MAAALRGKLRGWDRKRETVMERARERERGRQTWLPALSTFTDLAQQC